MTKMDVMMKDFLSGGDTSCFDYILDDYACPDEYRRLFVNFDDGSQYEIKLVKEK